MKGILLAGGSGSRLHPLTRVVSKQLMPVYDKPMVYYPLATLLQSGVREILVISGSGDLPRFRELLGDGSQLGVRFEYAVQPSPDGIAQAFLIAERFLEGGPAALALGDNLLDGAGVAATLAEGARLTSGGMIFACEVADPRPFGVVELDADGRPIGIEEKPRAPRSSLAVPGLFFFDGDVVDVARGLAPSSRGELEITDVSRAYMRRGTLRVRRLDPGVAWLDTGTYDSLLAAGNYIQGVERRTGRRVAALEEVAWRMGYIDDAQLCRLVDAQPDGEYARYLRGLLR